MLRDWCATATPSDLDLVARALDDGRVDLTHDSRSALQALGVADVGGLSAFLLSAPCMEPKALAWCLRRLAAERRVTSDRVAQSAQLVWSGPTEGNHGLRDTRAVLDELFGRAEHRITLATYVIYDGLRSLARLARRMRERPSLEVDFYVDLKSVPTTDAAGAHPADVWLTRFRREHWPADLRLPSIWYDPATLRRSAGVSLHAKCVVVDARWAFVTSANFTEAAQARNVEVGVLLDHPTLAQALSGRFLALRERGHFCRMV